MKNTIVISAIAFVLLFSACNKPSDNNSKTNNSSQIFNLDTTKLKTGDVFYQCEMDLEVISDKPGNCPKCEMELTAVKKK